MAKRGPKATCYITTWGETISGLGKLADGRWFDLEDRTHPWTSSDERDAIKEFHKRRAKRKGEVLPVVTRRFPISKVDQQIDEAFQPELEFTIDAEEISVETAVPSQPLWDLFARMIRENPKLAAERTGIKELAWLQDLEPPPAPLLLSEIGELYKQKNFKDPNETRGSQSCWQEFCEAVAPAITIKEISSGNLHKYHENTMALV